MYKNEPAKPKLRVDDLNQALLVVTTLRTRLNTLENNYLGTKKEYADAKKEYIEFKENSTKIRRVTGNNQAEIQDTQHDNQIEGQERDVPTGDQVPNIL